ncbi:sigma factor [Conyzicola sp.]|uniref:sigma factor n=1 Tax=Conyzicola sp. TaxID=1969404 RepID=UPI00398984C8
MDLARYISSTDDELLAEVAKGDQTAFGELYDRFAPHVFARVRQQIADRKLADEMVLEVFLEFWRQAPRLDRSVGRVATWLFTAPLVGYERLSGTAARVD